MHGKNTQKPSCGNGFRQGHSASIEISLQRQKEKHLPKQVLFFLSMVAEKDTSVYVNLMFYSFILRNIVSAMYTIADIRWLCYTFNILLPCIQAIY